MKPWRIAMLVGVGSPAAAAVHAQLKAFPEAEGFGRFATGGRTNLSSATVYHVTNLNDSGPGSFRDAVSHSNRFVVFDVGGIAKINSVVTFASNITIAGQTASGGFQVYGNRVAVSRREQSRQSILGGARTPPPTTTTPPVSPAAPT